MIPRAASGSARGREDEEQSWDGVTSKRPCGRKYFQPLLCSLALGAGAATAKLRRVTAAEL